MDISLREDLLLVNLGGETDNKSLKLQTRKSRHIPNVVRPKWPDYKIAEAQKWCIQVRPNIALRSAAGSRYNCVGMVFASRRTWVDPEHVPTILDDDGYTLLADIRCAQLGDVIVYRDDSGEIVHVGIIIDRREDLSHANVTFKVLSKWGLAAEYFHELHDVLPHYGIPTEVWTDRESI